MGAGGGWLCRLDQASQLRSLTSAHLQFTERLLSVPPSQKPAGSERRLGWQGWLLPRGDGRREADCKLRPQQQQPCALTPAVQWLLLRERSREATLPASGFCVK